MKLWSGLAGLLLICGGTYLSVAIIGWLRAAHGHAARGRHLKAGQDNLAAGTAAFNERMGLFQIGG